MKKELLRYYQLDKTQIDSSIAIDRPKYKVGESSAVIARTKTVLRNLGDYADQDSSSLFTEKLKEAVKQAQKRFGLNADGIISASLIDELNVPIDRRIEQMLVNLERMRWMPKEAPGNRIVVNIPDYQLVVFERSKKVLSFDIVVGTSVNKTVIFNDTLKYIVFSPNWNVPETITRNEILPGILRNPDYLSRMNMEQTGIRNGIPIIRQRPGGGNALGKIKFIFPNSYNIYFNDTPSKTLFNQSKRAFSHGCIRVNHPDRLAAYLLRDQPQRSADAIWRAMNDSTERWVTLKEPVPVVLTYLTSWIDSNGLLNFREDIYGRDAKMADRLFTKGM